MKLQKQFLLIYCVMALLHMTAELAHSQRYKALIEGLAKVFRPVEQKAEWEISLKNVDEIRLQLEEIRLKRLEDQKLQQQKFKEDLDQAMQSLIVSQSQKELQQRWKEFAGGREEKTKQLIKEGSTLRKPPNPQAFKSLMLDAQKLVNTKMYSEAITVYEKAYAEAENLINPFIHPPEGREALTLVNNAMGEVCLKRGLETLNSKDFMAASNDFTNVIKRSNNAEHISEAFFNRGLCNYYVGNLQAGIADFSNVILRNNTNNLIEAYFYRGHCEYAAGNFVAAIKDFKLASKQLNSIIESLPPFGDLDTNLKTKFIGLLFLKAELEGYTGDFGRIVTYDKILQIEANNVKAKTLKGICHIQNGELALGEALLTSDVIQQLDNKHIQADAWYHLGLVSHITDNSEQAQAYFEVAQSLEPDKLKDQQSDLVSIHTNIGWQYYFKGDYESSIRECQKAIALAPNRPEPYYNLARAYLTKGEKAAALTEWSKGLERDKNFEVFDLAIQDLSKAVEAKRLNESDGYYGKHSLYLNKGMIEAERGAEAASKESLRGAYESKKALLSSVVEKVTFEDKAGKSNYEARSIFSEFADNPKAILQEYWIPIDVKEVKIIDSPKPALKLSNGILEIDGKIKLEEIRTRFGNGTIIDEMTEIKNHLNPNDPPIAYLANAGLVISYPAKDCNTLFVDLSISRLEIERITSSYNQAQERFASNGFALKKQIQKLKKKENVTEADGAGLLAPAIFLDRIQEAVGGEIDRIIVKPDKSMSGINFRVIQAIQQLSQQRKKTISVRVDQPQLLRALNNTRKSLQVNLQESVFLVTLPLDEQTFEQSAFGKASMSRGIEWSDYEQNELKTLQQEIKKLQKLIGKENVILNATREDFLKVIEERPSITLTLIAEHKVAENADYIEMADGLWNVRELEREIEPKKLPTTSVFNFITCKGKNILVDMFLRKGATVVSTSVGEVELGHGLRRYVQTVEQMKKGKGFEAAHEEATFKVLKETFEGKAKFSPNLKGIPIEKSELNEKQEKKEFGL